MTSKDSNQDQELLDRYRRASDTDAAAPSDAVRNAILAESRRVAGQLASKESPPAFDTSRPAANDSRWKITAFGTAGAALLAALLIAPRYWESLPPAQQRTASATAPTAAPAAPAAPAAAAESKSANADAAAPAPKLESIAPSRRSEPQEMAELHENAAPSDHAPLDKLLDKKNAQLAQNYAPAPPLALRPAPAPNAPIAGYSQSGALSMSADRSARAARERNALEPVNLQSASAAGDLAQATLLLDQGAGVDARDTQGRTPLLLAVAQNRIAVVRLLLARGADPNAADNTGVTPLQQAKDKDLHDVAALLEKAGAR